MDLSAPSYAIMLELLLPTRSYFLSILFFSFLSIFILCSFVIPCYLFCILLFHTLFFLIWFYNRSNVPMTSFILNPLNHLFDPTTSSYPSNKNGLSPISVFQLNHYQSITASSSNCYNNPFVNLHYIYCPLSLHISIISQSKFTKQTLYLYFCTLHISLLWFLSP